MLKCASIKNDSFIVRDIVVVAVVEYLLEF